jgi:hypothetical protein
VSQTPDIIPDGLPDHLPEGETLLWQGRPKWGSLAVNAFHVRKVAIYFAAIILGQGLWRLAAGKSIAEALQAVPVLTGLALAACALLMGLAWLSARTTRYTLTSKRAMMKVGIALPVIINIPYRQVDAVSFAVTGGGTGNLVFKPGGGVRLAYLLLWPHARPWHLSKPQPAFRDIPDVEAVASRLARVLGGQMLSPAATAHVPAGHMIAAE